MRSVTLRAPAKLNLHLGIYSELDERRYHRADSLMVALDLCDEVTVEELPLGSLGDDELPQVVCRPSVEVPAHKNTAFRAARALGERVGRVPRVRITIAKRVPDQAGMGGSSSDAAAVLRALCELWGIDAHAPAVFEAAQAVGADVPFFLDPVPTLLVGAGDVVAQKFAPLVHAVPVVLVRPQGPGVSTPVAYATFDEAPTQPASPEALCHVLQHGEENVAQGIADSLFNNLDPVACRLLPQVAEVRSWLLAQDGVLGGQVTGSGSCVFGVCPADEEARRIAKAAKARFGAWAYAAHMR